MLKAVVLIFGAKVHFKHTLPQVIDSINHVLRRAIFWIFDKNMCFEVPLSPGSHLNRSVQIRTQNLSDFHENPYGDFSQKSLWGIPYGEFPMGIFSVAGRIVIEGNQKFPIGIIWLMAFFYYFSPHSIFLVTKQMVQRSIVEVPFVFPSLIFLRKIKMPIFSFSQHSSPNFGNFQKSRKKWKMTIFWPILIYLLALSLI